MEPTIALNIKQGSRALQIRRLWPLPSVPISTHGGNEGIRLLRAAAAAARKRAGVATACYSRGRARVEVEEEAEQQQQSQEHPRFEQTSHVASIAMWWRGGIVDAGGHFKVDRVMPISFYFSLS